MVKRWRKIPGQDAFFNNDTFEYIAIGNKTQDNKIPILKNKETISIHNSLDEAKRALMDYIKK